MNFLIMGTSRSGKTLLTNMIASQIGGYNKISTDALRMSFKQALPHTNIDFSKGEGNQVDFPNFLECYFDISTHNDNKHQMYYIIEGTPLPEEYVLRFAQKPNTKVIYLGKSNLSPQQFYDMIREFEPQSHGAWTKRLDDATLLSWCTDWIKKSQYYQQFCKQNNLLFFDTSFNQMQVLENIVEKIKDGTI